jgi:hypothetical protein
MDELAEFPNGAYDDQVDAWSLVMNYLKQNSTSGAIYVLGQPRQWPEASLPVGEPIFRGLFSKVL